jgi:23S rRNA pseudouridine1911/1915/1917 synthase
MDILHEDNHLIAINKKISDIVQGDKTGDESLDKKLKAFLKKKYNKPGKVYLGVPHRLDRPVSGVVLFTKTSKALSRINKLFQEKKIEKYYWAIVKNKPIPEKGKLVHYIFRNTSKNKSFAHDKEVPGSKKAILEYAFLKSIDRYHLLEIKLHTGRHHQIRAQLAKINCPIKGDLKYGFPRSNKNGGISLHAREIKFTHPVSKEGMKIVAPLPDNDLWDKFQMG